MTPAISGLNVIPIRDLQARQQHRLRLARLAAGTLTPEQLQRAVDRDRAAREWAEERRMCPWMEADVVPFPGSRCR